MLKSEILHFKEIYKFHSDHFLVNRTVFILIEKTLFKIINNCDFRPNNTRSEKMLRSKILHLKEIYKFHCDHFLVKHTVLILIEKTLFKIINNCDFRPNNTRYEKMLRSKILHLKEIYKFHSDHFLVKRTVFVLIEKTLFKLIKNCDFRPNNTRYEKMLRSKIVHLKEIYQFDFDHFLVKRTVIILIKKTLFKIIKNCDFRPNNTRYEKMSRSKIVDLEEIYKFHCNHFLVKRTVFVLIEKTLFKLNIIKK